MQKKAGGTTLILILTIATIITALQPQPTTTQTTTTPTLRLYGLEGLYAGDGTTTDPQTGLLAETQPYTDPAAILDPENTQAPRSDSLTLNPAYLSQTLTDGHEQLYNQISVDGVDGNQKVFLRIWYEPEHWDLDLDANSSPNNEDLIFPALIQEYTYILLQNTTNTPTCGHPGQTKLVFPIGMGDPKPVYESPQVVNARPEGHGLETLDPDWDGVEDIVTLHSEATLANTTNIQTDFDGDNTLDHLDGDGTQLSGDELIILSIGPKTLHEGDTIQFWDHMARLAQVNGALTLEIYFTGDLVPRYVDTATLNTGELLLAGRHGTLKLPAGGDNLGQLPPGPWFLYAENIGTTTATILVGRAFGNVFTAMQNAPYTPDLTSGDPWFLKRAYVDGHEYNVVALLTLGSGEEACLTSITLRTPLPKVGVEVLEHSLELEDYPPEKPFSVLPPFNMNHSIIVDIWPEWRRETPPTPFGPVMGDLLSPVEPLEVWYVEEEVEPRFLGELEQLLGELLDGTPYTGGSTGISSGAVSSLFWWTREHQTLPNQYTELSLPGEHGPYLLTTAFQAPHSTWNTHDDENLLDQGDGGRLKLWFDPVSGSTDIYVNLVGVVVNAPPVANAGPDRTVVVDTPVEFDAGLSYDPDGTITSYSWDFGDGETGSGVVVTHSYGSVGVYTVVLTVVDNLGATDSDSVVVEVVPPAGELCLDLDPGSVGLCPGEDVDFDLLVENLESHEVMVYLEGWIIEEEDFESGNYYAGIDEDWEVELGEEEFLLGGGDERVVDVDVEVDDDVDEDDYYLVVEANGVLEHARIRVDDKYCWDRRYGYTYGYSPIPYYYYRGGPGRRVTYPEIAPRPAVPEAEAPEEEAEPPEEEPVPERVVGVPKLELDRESVSMVIPVGGEEGFTIGVRNVGNAPMENIVISVVGDIPLSWVWFDKEEISRLLIMGRDEVGVTIRVPVEAEPGIYEGEIKIAPGNAEPGGVLLRVEIPQPPQLVVTALSTAKREYSPGEELELSMVLSNTGGYPLEGGTITTIVDKNGRTVFKQDKKIDLEPGEIKTISRRVLVDKRYGPGEYTVEVKVHDATGKLLAAKRVGFRVVSGPSGLLMPATLLVLMVFAVGAAVVVVLRRRRRPEDKAPGGPGLESSGSEAVETSGIVVEEEP